MRNFTIQYFIEIGQPEVAHVAARTREEALEKFRKMTDEEKMQVTEGAKHPDQQT